MTSSIKQKTRSERKTALDNYLEADKYLAKLTFLGGSSRVYNELQKLLPANMSVTDWLRVHTV